MQHNIIKEKLLDLNEFFSKGKIRRPLPRTKEMLSLLLNTKTDIHLGSVKTCVKPLHTF